MRTLWFLLLQAFGCALLLLSLASCHALEPDSVSSAHPLQPKVVAVFAGLGSLVSGVSVPDPLLPHLYHAQQLYSIRGLWKFSLNNILTERAGLIQELIPIFKETAQEISISKLLSLFFSITLHRDFVIERNETQASLLYMHVFTWDSVVSNLLSVANFQTLKSLKRPSLFLKMSVVQLQAEDSVQLAVVCLFDSV